jgi:Zn-dependent protease
VNRKERELLEAVGTKPGLYRVISRRPWTIAVGRRAYLPGLMVGLIVFGIVAPRNPLAAVPAALVAALATTVCLAAHEAGHLLFGRLSRGVKPRMLVLSSGGGISILEGRHEEPRGAALFAAGGPIASVVAGVTLLAAGLLLPTGPFAVALTVPAVITLAVAALNLLPIAPMDGYALFRSWLWSNLGNRAEAERRALDWSRVVIVVLLAVSIATSTADGRVTLIALLVCATLVAQHHRVFTRMRAESRNPGPR